MTVANLVEAAMVAGVKEEHIISMVTGIRKLPVEEQKRIIRLTVNHPSPNVRSAAAIAIHNALERYEDSDFDSFGSALLRDSDPTVRASAATWLSRTRLREMVYDATRDPSPLVRQHAYWALFGRANWNEEKTILLARAALADESKKVKKLVLEKILSVYSSQPSNILASLVEDMLRLIHYGNDDISAMVERVIVNRGAHNDGERVRILTELRSAIGEANPDVFVVAVHGGLDSKEVFLATIDCLAYPATGDLAAYALARHRKDRSVDITTVKNDLQEGRFPWGICGPNSFLPETGDKMPRVVSEAMNSGDLDKRKIAFAVAYTLLYCGRQGVQAWLPVIQRAAKDKCGVIRAMAMNAAVYLVSSPLWRDALKIGLSGANDSEEIVRGAAIRLVGTLPDKNEEINTAILNALTDGSRYVRNIASRALSMRINFRY